MIEHTAAASDKPSREVELTLRAMQVSILLHAIFGSQQMLANQVGLQLTI
jgi:hypothetical protein